MGKKGEFHRILIDGEIIFDNLGQGEFFERMEDLSIQYYQTGSPHPNTISTQIIMEDN